MERILVQGRHMNLLGGNICSGFTESGWATEDIPREDVVHAAPTAIIMCVNVESARQGDAAPHAHMA